MSYSLQPVRVATGFDEEGMMVLDEEQQLFAVLVCLSADNEMAPGQWFVEAGFGRLGGGDHPTFSHLDMAQDWIRQRLAKGAIGSLPHEDSFERLGRAVPHRPSRNSATMQFTGSTLELPRLASVRLTSGGRMTISWWSRRSLNWRAAALLGLISSTFSTLVSQFLAARIGRDAVVDWMVVATIPLRSGVLEDEPSWPVIIAGILFHQWADFSWAVVFFGLLGRWTAGLSPRAILLIAGP
jgi:hypothetical protein